MEKQQAAVSSAKRTSPRSLFGSFCLFEARQVLSLLATTASPHRNGAAGGEAADFFGDGGGVDAVVSVEVADGAGLAEMFDPQ